MSENTINAAFRRMGFTKDEVTAHGLRSTFFFGAALIAALLPYLAVATTRHSLRPAATL